MTSGACPRVAALVMAAGRSTRMAPRNKLLLQDGCGRAMVARVVQACCASRAAQVLVVTGHEPGLVERAVRAGEVRADIGFAHAADHADGLSASLRAGIAAIRADVDAAMVCLGDMPLVTTTLLDTLIAAWAPARGHRVVVPVWQGRRGNPVLWGRCFFAEMQALSGDGGARPLLRLHAGVVAEVAADGPGVLTDFDTPDSLKVTGAAYASSPSWSDG